MTPPTSGRFGLLRFAVSASLVTAAISAGACRLYATHDLRRVVDDFESASRPFDVRFATYVPLAENGSPRARAAAAGVPKTTPDEIDALRHLEETPGSEWSSADRALAAGLRSASATSFATLADAAAFRVWSEPSDGVGNLPRRSEQSLNVIRLGRALLIALRLDLLEGDRHAAAAKAEFIGRLAELARSSPILLQQLLGRPIETQYLYATQALNDDERLTGDELEATLRRLAGLETLGDSRRWVVAETLDFFPTSDPGFFWRSSMSDLVAARILENRLAFFEAVGKPWPEFDRWSNERITSLAERRARPWYRPILRPDRVNAAIIEELLLPNLRDAVAQQDAVQSSRRLAVLALTVQRDDLDAKQVETLLDGLAPDPWTGGRLRQEADGERPLALEVVGARDQWTKELKRLAPPFRWPLGPAPAI